MPDAATEVEHIRLSLPARHEYARIARIAVAALALRLGFTYREVEDLRLAIDESLILLLGADRPDKRITIRFGTERGLVEMRATADLDEQAGEEARERFVTLVDDLVDEWEIAEDRRSVLIRKRHHTRDTDSD